MDEIEKLRKLIATPTETECVELKVNNSDPEKIGEYISALANSAALRGAPFGHVIWGVEDGSHQLVGTVFDPFKQKKGNEPLEAWLTRLISPALHFSFRENQMDGKRLVHLEIASASHTPVRFREFEFIRVGQTTQRLKDHPEKARALWASFAGATFEAQDVRTFASNAEALATLDFESYLRLTRKQTMRAAALSSVLEGEGFLRTLSDGRCTVTNLGALLLAKNLDDFPGLSRKAPRAIFYQGRNREVATQEQEGKKGYAAGFEGLIRYLDSRLPKSEFIREALREEVSLFPPVAVRELVANALIHQDLSLAGAGPLVEVFEDRIEISNPGVLLVDSMRIIDAPPRSRNERLATFLRRVGICEERGSGVDRAVAACETFQLPAPYFMVVEGFTKAFLYAPRPLKEMSRADKNRACYQHAVLQWLSDSQMTNASLRKRFGIKDGSAAQASRMIKEALEEEVIKEFDPQNNSNKHNKYVPFWA